MVGVDHAAGGGHPQVISLGADAVLPVVEQGQPCPVRAVDARPFVAGLLGPVGLPGQEAVGHRQGRAGGFHLHREGELDDLERFLPIQQAADVERPPSHGKGEILDQGGIPVPAGHPQRGPHRPGFKHAELRLPERAALPVKGIHSVPPGIGVGVVDHQGAGHRAGGELPPAVLVQQADQGARGGVEFRPQEFVFQEPLPRRRRRLLQGGKVEQAVLE